MKYYYLVNGEIIDEYNNKWVAYHRFQDTKIKSDKLNQTSWYRMSEHLYQIMANGKLHTYCTYNDLNEFLYKYSKKYRSNIKQNNNYVQRMDKLTNWI